MCSEDLSYDSFGIGQGSLTTRYDYTGRERDSLSGLMYYRSRWYDPNVGRFISEDPIGLRGGDNLYAYVKNSPLGFTDPLGLCAKNQNMLLAKCYRDAVNGYDAGDVGHFVKIAKWIAPTNSLIGGVVGGVNGFQGAGELSLMTAGEGFTARVVSTLGDEDYKGLGAGFLEAGLVPCPV